MGITAGEQAALAAKLSVIFPHLDERRLVAGAEARALGHGGIRAGGAGGRDAGGHGLEGAAEL
jgi:hypothetical protein